MLSGFGEFIQRHGGGPLIVVVTVDGEHYKLNKERTEGKTQAEIDSTVTQLTTMLLESPIPKEKFAILASLATDAPTRRYYEDMSQIEDTNTAARQVMMNKYKQENGLILMANGRCKGYERDIIKNDPGYSVEYSSKKADSSGSSSLSISLGSTGAGVAASDSLDSLMGAMFDGFGDPKSKSGVPKLT